MVGTKVDKILSGRMTGGPYRRPNFPTEFKRQLVEQTFDPGASVALIARRNDVNANLLFKWRRAYLKGAYGPPLPEHVVSKPECTTPSLLPVTVIADTPALPARAPETGTSIENVCEVEFDRARLCIRGDVSPAMLRLLIRELSR
jgi:transposase